MVLEKLERLASRKTLEEEEIQKELAQLAKQTCRRRAWDTFLILLIRVAYMLEIALFYYYVIALTSNLLYLLASIGLIIIIVDTVYIVGLRSGKEFSW